MSTHIQSATPGDDDEDPEEQMRRMITPEMIDHQVRAAVKACRASLPKDRRNPDEVQRQMRRLLDRAIRAMREDEEAWR